MYRDERDETETLRGYTEPKRALRGSKPGRYASEETMAR